MGNPVCEINEALSALMPNAVVVVSVAHALSGCKLSEKTALADMPQRLTCRRWSTSTPTVAAGCAAAREARRAAAVSVATSLVRRTSLQPPRLTIASV
eukprot:6204090-Pleurochrysis_carterae.AAC.3